MNQQSKGVVAALVDGFLLALWGLACKGLAQFSPGVYEYALVFYVAGLGHLSLAMFPDSGKGKSASIVSKRIVLLLSFFIMISVAQFYLGVQVYVDDSSDISISSFLRNSSLLFAALLAHNARFSGGLFIESRLDGKSVSGMILFLLGAWCFFGMPYHSFHFGDLLVFWVVGSFFIGFNRALTELLMQNFAKSITKTQMNLGIGSGMLLTGVLGISFSSPRVVFSGEYLFFLLSVGLIIPLMQAFRYSALSYLNEVLGKKAYTIWMYLFASMLLAAYFYGESLAWQKWLGLLIGGFAVLLLDRNAYRAIFLKVEKKV